MSTGHPQDESHSRSLSSPEEFWDLHAKTLTWTKPYAKVFDFDKSSGKWEWFPGGELSSCYNCLDRHVIAGNGDYNAVIWDSPVTKTVRKITYKELLGEVQLFAGLLQEMGVKKGDTVLIYSNSTTRPKKFRAALRLT